MRPSFRSISSAPVTTRRTARTFRHFSASASSRQSAGMLGELPKMHRALVAGEAVEPGLLHGEAEHRGKPGGERAEQTVEHGQRRAPRQAVVRIAIERVLADVEIEGREIVDAEIEQRVEARA